MADVDIPPVIDVDAPVNLDGEFAFTLCGLERTPNHVQLLYACLVWDADPAPDDNVAYWVIEFDSVFSPNHVSNNTCGAGFHLHNSPYFVGSDAGAPRTFKHYTLNPPLKIAVDSAAVQSGTHIARGRIRFVDSDVTASQRSANGLEVHNRVATTDGSGARLTPDRIILQLEVARVV